MGKDKVMSLIIGYHSLICKKIENTLLIINSNGL